MGTREERGKLNFFDAPPSQDYEGEEPRPIAQSVSDSISVPAGTVCVACVL